MCQKDAVKKGPYCKPSPYFLFVTDLGNTRVYAKKTVLHNITFLLKSKFMKSKLHQYMGFPQNHKNHKTSMAGL